MFQWQQHKPVLLCFITVSLLGIFCLFPKGSDLPLDFFCLLLFLWISVSLSRSLLVFCSPLNIPSSISQIITQNPLLFLCLLIPCLPVAQNKTFLSLPRPYTVCPLDCTRSYLKTSLRVLHSVIVQHLSPCSLLCSTCLLIFCRRLKYHSWWHRSTRGHPQRTSLQKDKTRPAVLQSFPISSVCPLKPARRYYIYKYVHSESCKFNLMQDI